MGKKTRRQFTKEFKTEAIRLATSGTRTATEVAENLEIRSSLLSKWIKASKTEGADAFRGQGKRSAAEEEVWQLKLRNRQLEQELEFLKKVSRYFAKDPK